MDELLHRLGSAGWWHLGRWMALAPHVGRVRPLRSCSKVGRPGGSLGSGGLRAGGIRRTRGGVVGGLLSGLALARTAKIIDKSKLGFPSSVPVRAALHLAGVHALLAGWWHRVVVARHAGASLS